MVSVRTITLGDGSTVKVDASDYKYLSQWKWQNVSGYAARSAYPAGMKGRGYRVLMHRQITGCPEKLLVDHINHDTLDNRKENLRIASASQNQWNKQLMKNNKSGVTGVVWDPVNQKWRASITVKDKYISLGRYTVLEDAKRARLAGELEHFGEFARQAR